MDPHEPCSSTEAGEQPNPSPDEAKWVAQRAPEKPGDQILSLEALAWFDSLPQDVRPNNLAQRYPRICNRVVDRWKYPDLMVHFFDDLLMDSRAGRKGFPMIIALEIASLKEHFLATLSVTNDDVWNQVVASRIF
ncbi:MAG: hypothetical protein WBX11_06020 [Thiobacillaceae bacterium]|jgi:hypothetical protein